MVRCIVPNCQSGYDSQHGNEKVHFFKVPKDLVDEYQKAIKRKCFVVKSTHFVCHKHYLAEDILWKREVKDAAGNVIASIDYKIPRLKKGVLPTQFPKSKERKLPEKRQVGETYKRNKIDALEISFEDSNVLPPDVLRPGLEVFFPDSPSPDVPSDHFLISLPGVPPVVPSNDVSNNPKITVSKVEKLRRIKLFETLFSNKLAFQFPTAWTRADVTDANFQAITFVQWSGRLEDGKFNTVCTKKIVLYKDMTIYAYVFDVSIEMRKLNFTNEFVSYPEEVENIIKTFHKYKVCEGCLTPNSISNVETSFAFRDNSKNLRHQKCTMILDVDSLHQKKYCLPCQKVKPTLAVKTVRL